MNGKQETKSTGYFLEDPALFAAESKRLVLQAKHLFEIERNSLECHKLFAANFILELGCGNGAFLRQIYNNSPDKKYFGIDRNDRLIWAARESGDPISYDICELTKESEFVPLLKSKSPDYLIARHVFQHLSPSEQTYILKIIKATKLPKTRLLLMDTDDLYFEHAPHSEAIEELLRRKMEKQAAVGGDRTVGSKLYSLLQQNGYIDLKETFIRYSSGTLGIGVWYDTFWPVLRSGLTEPYSQGDQNLLSSAQGWFDAAKTNNSYSASYKIYHASGN